MTVDTLHDMFVHTLKDIYYAETKIARTLPKMIRAADDSALKSALAGHLDETKGQIGRLVEVFDSIGEKARGKKCEAIEGILKEGEGAIEDTEGSPMRDCAIVASGQAVEHYEIVRYRGLIAWAEKLNLGDAVTSALQQNLDEELHADETLTDLGDTVADAGDGADDEDAPPVKKVAARRTTKPAPPRAVAKTASGKRTVSR